jgi:hypothetical protein
MRSAGLRNLGCAVALSAAAIVSGCSDSGEDDSPGPGGSTVSGNVSAATTASVAAERRWLAWLGEQFLGFARPAHAQVTDTTVGGITVIVRGQGREVSDLTDSAGGFVLTNAPTGDVIVLFRRGSCEGSLPIGAVISNSTLNLIDVDFLCDGSSVGDVTFADLSERFNGVTRDDPDIESNVRLCTRVGDDDVLRDISAVGADLRNSSGGSIGFGDIEENDLLQIDGFRSDGGSSFTFDTQRIEIVERDVRDECGGL